MIVKKPYAFLIKNFRLVHGLLFALILYLSIKSLNIYSFFSAYASTGAYELRANMASSYVDFIMFGACILVTFISFVIYYILSMKNKDNKTYLYIFLYYIGLFVFYIYIHSVLNRIVNTAIGTEGRGILNEVCLIVLIPQIIFAFIILGRTLGFNLKQFDFKRDLEELEIDSTDNEEVELNLGGDSYKIKRFFRKFLRLSKYFILENKMFVIGISCIIILVILLNVYTRITVYSVNYKENQQVLASTLWYEVNESYITDSDYANNVIYKGKKYVVANVTVKNNTSEEVSLSRETFTLDVDNRGINPIFTLGEKFSDLGYPFTPSDLKKGESKIYAVIFEINDADVKSDYVLKIKNFDERTLGAIDTKFKEIVIKPKNLTNIISKDVLKIPNEVDLSGTLLDGYKISLASYEIADSFKEKYTVTLNNKVVESIYSVIPKSNNKGKVSVLKLKTSFINTTDTVYMSNYIKIPVDLFDYYGIIEYRHQGEIKRTKLKKINVSYEKDKYAYLELPSEVKDANKVDLILLIRGVKYTFNLK